MQMARSRAGRSPVRNDIGRTVGEPAHLAIELHMKLRRMQNEDAQEREQRHAIHAPAETTRFTGGGVEGAFRVSPPAEANQRPLTHGPIDLWTRHPAIRSSR